MFRQQPQIAPELPRLAETHYPAPQEEFFHPRPLAYWTPFSTPCPVPV